MSYHGGPLDYRFRWNNYNHPALVAAFDMSSLTPGGLLKNMTGDDTYDATINGAPTYVAPLISAKRTKCMDFNPVNNDYLSIVNPVSGRSQFTIIFWGEPDSSTNIIFSRGGANNVFIYLDGQIVFRMQVITSNYLADIRYIFGRKYMIAFTFDGGDITLYMDGVKRYWRAKTTGGVNPVDAVAYIGQYFDGSLRYDGRLDNMMFWDIALTPSQVWEIYRSAHSR